MKRFIVIFMTLCLVLGMSSISVWAAEVGDKLLQPEAGWQRIDDTESKFIYNGANWNSNSNFPNVDEKCYNKTLHWTKDNMSDTSIKFIFYGTQIRLIQTAGQNYSDDMPVTIDGVNDYFNLRAMASSACDRQYIVYEKTGLTLGFHIVTLNCGTNGKFRLENDAIDIDADGYLVAPDSIVWATGITLDKTSLNMTTNQTNNLTAIITPSNVTISEVTWKSSDISVVKVDPNTGLVTSGNMPGTATVTATTTDGTNLSATCIVTVTPNNSTAKLSVLLNEGENVQLSTSYNLDNNKNYTWSSTNEGVATVDANGKITAIAEGIADIYAQNADGTFKEYIPVKVVKGIADELRLAVHLKAGEKAKLYLTDDESKVTWSSMDNSIATVSADGKVTGVKKGLAIIKGELEGKTYQIYVRVNG